MNSKYLYILLSGHKNARKLRFEFHIIKPLALLISDLWEPVLSGQMLRGDGLGEISL